MARWGGWGAGPAGSGLSGPSRVFLAAGLVLAVVMTAIQARDRRGWEAGITAAAAVYFALRLFAGLGRRRR